MKTTLSILALLIVSSIALAQNVTKMSDSTKQQKTKLVSGALPSGVVISSASRISMDVTVPKQTQGTTFGEKVNAGLHTAGSSVAQNPLYNGNTNQGVNPLHDPKAKTASPVGPIKGVIVKGGKND